MAKYDKIYDIYTHSDLWVEYHKHIKMSMNLRLWDYCFEYFTVTISSYGGLLSITPASNKMSISKS